MVGGFQPWTFSQAVQERQPWQAGVAPQKALLRLRHSNPSAFTRSPSMCLPVATGGIRTDQGLGVLELLLHTSHHCMQWREEWGSRGHMSEFAQPCK